MEARVAVLESDVGHLKADVADLRADMKGVRTDISQIKVDLAVLKATGATKGFIVAVVIAAGAVLTTLNTFAPAFRRLLGLGH